ncbi:hypothetical protein DRO55_01205 [Candidatus Bathyarchaeota archaeon]|nr:MAG: hypothetical protein DRO55_01205 [Candidatus Bathyarchaeota archaeon]
MVMSKLECVLSTILHEEPDVVPQAIYFMDRMAESKFAPNLSGIKDDLKRAVKYAEFLDHFTISCGGGGFRSKVVETGRDYWIIEWETGARWMIMRRPFSFERRYIHYPVMSEDDLDKLELPDPDDPERYEGIRERVRYFTEKGYFTSCGINGFFSGVWYFLCPFNLWLKGLLLNKPFAMRIIGKLGEFNYKAAKNLLETGVHSIGWVDDLGYNKGMFISPKIYEEIIYPWHRRLIDLAHKHGAFVNMHSHGNINAIFHLLVDAKLDVINPVGPSDNMDLKELKEKFGDRITLQGGISKFIGEMTLDELREHIKDRLSIGSPGGGYILDSEGGIPINMSREKFEFFMECSRRYRRNRP